MHRKVEMSSVSIMNCCQNGYSGRLSQNLPKGFEVIVLQLLGVWGAGILRELGNRGKLRCA